MSWSLGDAGRDLVLGMACVGCGRPGRVLCGGCQASLPTSGAAAWPDPTPPGLVVPYAAGAYAGVLRELLVQHKEHRVFGLAAPLGVVLSHTVGALASALGAPDGPVALVPVPSRRRVVRTRGHDPLLRMTRCAAAWLRRRGTRARICRRLVPVGRVDDQAGLSAGDRARNLAGAFACPTGPAPVGLVVVVDDVLTTGSTAREAQRALEAAGVTVAGIATVAATRRTRPVPWADSGGSLPF